MLNTYKIVFETEEEGQYSITISDINDALSDVEIAAAVNKMLASKAVYTSSGSLTAIKSISKVDTTATELNVA